MRVKPAVVLPLFGAAVGLRIVFGKVIQLLVGGVIGGILGAIITGDPRYSLAWGLGVGAIFVLAMIFGAYIGVKKKAAAAPAVQTEAVLNPVSTAQPSPGVVLNGVPTGVPEGMPDLRRPPGSARPRWWRALSIATILVGAGLALIPSFSTVAWIADDIAAGRPFDGRDMQTGRHLQEAFDELVGVVGSTEVTSIYFFSDSITVTAPTTPGGDDVDRYIWQYGRATREGPDYSQPDDIREDLFDAGDIDMNMVAALVRDAKTEAGIRDLDSVYPYISRFGGDDPTIMISLTGSYDDAYYTYTIHGEFIEKYGSAFDDR
jgi:hypothetical protein